MENVTYKHPDYVKALPIWKKCRDAVEGQEAIHAATTTYLRKLTDEGDDAYQIRLFQTTFYDASYRTVEGMQGMLFRKRYGIEPEDMRDNDLFKDVDGCGHTLPEFLKILSFEAEVVGRFGLLTDHTSVVEGLTVADVQGTGARARNLLYKAESIINWRHVIKGGKRELSLVVLTEDTGDFAGEWSSEMGTQYRVLDLHEGFYRVRIFRGESVDNSEPVQVGADVYPIMGGEKFTSIPFSFYPDIDVSRSIILGLVNMNISHYHTTAKLEDCESRLVPTTMIFGWSPEEGDSLYLGSQSAMCFPDPQTTAKILEPSGKFGTLKESIEAKEQRMAILGTRILAPEKKQAESAMTASIHRMGGVSTLAALAIVLSDLVTLSTNRMLVWSGNTTAVVVTLNRDFNPMDISPQMLTAMLASVQAGQMSFQTWFANLQRGEIISDGVTAEEEEERIASQSPSAPPEVEQK